MSAIDHWRDKLAELFPSNDIEEPFDLAPAIFNAYANGTVPSITIHLRASMERPRRYLGTSGLGASCPRCAWAQWRGLGDPFHGRLLRLFRTGDVYEERMRAELEAIGFECRGDQAAFEAFGGRVGGHSDGFVRIADLPWALWEAKTANHRRFTALKKLLREESGTPALKEWDEKYWHQVHIYMAAFGLDVCLYSVTDKDTDDYVAFLVPRDDEAVATAGELARSILDAVGPAPRGYSVPRTPECTRFCDFAEWCWHGAPLPVVCGTCTQWRDGTCARTGLPATQTCDGYEAVPSGDNKVVSEWEAL